MNAKYIQYGKIYGAKYGLSIAAIAVAIFVAGSLATFCVNDQSLLYHARNGFCNNIFGYVGSSLAALLIYTFGSAAYIFSAFICYLSLFTLGFRSVRQENDRIAGAFLFLMVSSLLCKLYSVGYCEFSACGGIVGATCASLLSYFDVGAQIFITYIILFASVTLMSRFSHLYISRVLLKGIRAIIYYCLQLDHMPARIVRGLATGIAYICYGLAKVVTLTGSFLKRVFLKDIESSIVEFERDEKLDQSVDELMREMLQDEEEEQEVLHNDLFVQKETSLMPEKEESNVLAVHADRKQSTVEVKKAYTLPDIEIMLSQGGSQIKHKEINQGVLDEQAAILEEKLAQFGIKGKVVRVHPGPVITLFEYKPESHIKLSKILALEDDLAMALQAINIRILAPIPGKAVVGFEVANKVRKPVLLSNIFHSPAWNQFDGHLPLILGENTHGEHIVVDLATMPHLLIAGSTGSGKSVAMNCMLVSLLCACNPEQVKFIIIDPKQLEFAAYEDIAHLLFPIITDSKKAVPVLKWLVSTMEERYTIMAELGVKNIFEYQKKVKEGKDLQEMPFIVLIIDELADLMMTTGKDVEDLIARIAQMSRAAGIHMIVATQRPSVDVITGLIKVNFPNRISFKVTSKIDSRTILDEMGAERLLGKGDMLFLNARDPDIKRVHGAYVSNGEIQFLVNHIKSQQRVSYLNIVELLAAEKNNDALYEMDQELYKEIVAVVQTCDEISISMIQRRFRIGYNRSARIVQALESDGIILPNDGGKMRRVIKD